ncbi:MAG: DUF1295 domain-containing protein [Myxococcaceae bacterium]|nr:DUF1295 domain-containing protein [Myxococcaceae bacterium]
MKPPPAAPQGAGDLQLARFKAHSANEGRVMNACLERTTSPPNSFGDAVVWWGFACVGLSGGAWWTMASAALMTFLLVRVPGVATQESAMKHRPSFAAYIASTSSFIPRPPRSPPCLRTRPSALSTQSASRHRDGVISTHSCVLETHGGCMLLDEIGFFAQVARAGTLAEAARQLELPKSTLSRAIARLEAKTKVPLLCRAARSFTLTEDGRRFFEAVGPHVSTMAEATRLLGRRADQPEGTLRVSAPLASGDLLGDAMVRFGMRYPRVRLDVELSSRRVELVREGFDVAFRATPTLRGDALTARKLTTATLGLYAAPTCLAVHGTPSSTDEVATHELVVHAPSLEASPLRPARLHAAFVAARMAVNEFGFVRSMLRASAGIGLLPAFHAARDVEDGRLVRLVPEWSHAIGALYLVFPTAPQLPRKVAAFRDFMVETFRAPAP